MSIVVEVKGDVTIAGTKVQIGPMVIPGVGAAVLYTTGDAFGTKFDFAVPKQGVIQGIRFYDVDDEGANMELWIFRDDFTQTADNAAFALSDADLHLVECNILIDTFRDAANNQVGVEDNLGIDFVAAKARLWGQWVTRGGPTIAVGAVPSFVLTIRSD